MDYKIELKKKRELTLPQCLIKLMITLLQNEMNMISKSFIESTAERIIKLNFQLLTKIRSSLNNKKIKTKQ